MPKVFRTPQFVNWIYPKRLWGFSNSNKVYLTFDDGPTTELTNWIVETLNTHNVKATFFCVGQNVKNNPDLYNELVSNGHVIGNHTMDHNNGNKTSRVKYIESVQEAAKYIDSALFRPPYGRLSLLKGASIKRNYKIVMWNWLSYDYDVRVPVEKILASARSEIRGGDILVLHDNKKVEERLKIILPELIEIIRHKGLEFDVISA